MATAHLRDLTGAVFRANPRYRLIPFDQIPADQHEALASIGQTPELFGVLVPLETGTLASKSVCHETARLFSELAEPAGLPARFRPESGRELNQEIAELVLDDVLEVASAGRFVGGAAAYPAVFRDQAGAEEGKGRLARLSTDALRYAAALQVDDAVTLSARLYFYNRLPVTFSWKRQWPDKGAVLRHLEVGKGRRPHAVWEQNYTLAPSPPSYRGWLMWTHRTRPPSRLKSRAFYKLYISPLPANMREAFAATRATLAHSWCPRFKIGCDAYGLLRPDKMVCYFESFDDLMRFAADVEQRIAGCPAHGVPFSASLTPDGLLSWGIDPPRDEARPAWLEPESWRLWIANRLASALIAARAEAHRGAIEPWRFALERLRLAGVDTETWTPDPSIWSATTEG